MKTLICLVVGCLGGVAATADPPKPPKPVGDLAPLQSPTQPSYDIIHDALEGGDAPPPADPILGGIVEIIKGRGSVIDGSVLDEREEVDSDPVADDRSPVPSPGFGDGPPRYDWTPQSAAGPAVANQEAALRVETAEMLLDLARRLEFLSGGGLDDEPLIRTLRHRAGQLLLHDAPHLNDS